MTYENKPNTGALFKRDKKSDKAPDYSGPFYGPGGEEMEIAAWLKKSKAGQTYMSVQVSEKFVREQPAEQKRDFDDDIPF